MNTFRKRVFEFTPQIDVEMPAVRIEEDESSLSSYGVVYNLIIQEQDAVTRMETCLTVEELTVLRDYINHLLDIRAEDKKRQGN